MKEIIYTISQAANAVEEKSYVLRYWEDELKIPIARNEQGHRYYTDKDIQLFQNIKELKKRGLQLKAIKECIPRLWGTEHGTTSSPVKQISEQDAVSMAAHTQTTPILSSKDKTSPQTIHSDGSAKSREDIILEFHHILKKLIVQSIKEKNSSPQERANRCLDETIRLHQQARREVAATNTAPPRKHRFFLSRRKSKDGL